MSNERTAELNLLVSPVHAVRNARDETLKAIMDFRLPVISCAVSLMADQSTASVRRGISGASFNERNV